MFKRSSRHRPKGKFIRIRRGLALYQTPCPYYFAHILDTRCQYKVRSPRRRAGLRHARRQKNWRPRSVPLMRLRSARRRFYRRPKFNGLHLTRAQISRLRAVP
jgi:hypothetical protein